MTQANCGRVPRSSPDLLFSAQMSNPMKGVYLPAEIALQTDGHGAFHLNFDEMLEQYAAEGVTQLRLGFDWGRLQPRAGGFSHEWAEWYSDVISAAKKHGIGVWASLLESELPHWFDDERGFSDPKSAGKHWPRFVELMGDSFGDRVAGWFPINDPIGFAARKETDDGQRHGEMVDTMVVAWRDAWRILRGGPPIAGSFGVRMVRPTDDSPEASERAQREDHLRWKTFLRGLRDGSVVIPGRADRELDDLAGAIDLIGIMFRSDLATDQSITDESLRRWQERATMLIHRVRDEAPHQPIVLSYRSARRGKRETQSDAAVMTEAFMHAVDDCCDDGFDIHSLYTEPTGGLTQTR